MRKPPLPVRLVALDLDGTVIAKDLSVSPAVVQAVARAKELGVPTTLVTGRMYASILPFTKLLGIDVPVVCYQGAGIYDLETGKVLRHQPVPQALAARLVEVARSRNIHIQLYGDGKYFVERQTPEGDLYAYVSGVRPERVPSLTQRFAHEDSTKVVFVTTAAAAGPLEADLRELCGDAAYVTRSNPEFVEVMAPGVDKGDALAFVARHLNIPLEQTLAVGDSWNDIPLLRAAAYGVAMGNAPAAAREAADAVVADVAGDGVVEAYARFVFPGVAEAVGS